MEFLKLLLLLTLLWTPSGGQDPSRVSQVLCVAMETCLLPCSFKAEGDLFRLEWIQTKEKLNAFFYEKGRVHPEKQDTPFRGRTSMSLEELSGGNGSLLLSSVTPRDQGMYLCQVTSSSTTMEYVNLRVEAPVKAVTLEWKGDVLVCSSEGVYPQPNVSWTPHSEHQTHEEPMKNGLYSVNRSLSLDPQAQQCYTCNVSTDTSWKSATYCLKPPVKRSANVTIPCEDSTAPEKSLKWTFNGDQTIVSRIGGEVSITASWSRFVDVSESGSLRLKEPGPEQEGEFVCELHTDQSTFTCRTELTKPDDSGVTAAVIGGLVTLGVLGVVAVIVFFVMLRKKCQKKLERRIPEQEPLLGDLNSLHCMLQRTFKSLSQDEMEKFKSLLMDQSVMGEFPTNELHTEEDVSEAMVRAYGVHSASVTKRLLQKLQRNDLLEKLSNYDPEEIIEKCKNDIKSRLRQRFRYFPEACGSGEELEFNEGYTEGDSGHYQDIINGLTQGLVLTKGGAGVGKTVLTQKFSLDWTEGRTHQDVQLLLPFSFRELHVLRDRRFSLVGLVHHFFSETKGLCSFQLLQLLFIFDGLDECRLPLDFSRTRVLTEPTESASVEELLVNLIRGSLLPSARLWITTRSAAANQIPAECVFMVTEVQGFSGEQKYWKLFQYFRNKFRDEATVVISHIKTSLYAMCYNPLFCWILSVVLHKNLEQTEEPELPKTLTEMYIHFLLVQTKVCKNILYEGRDETDSPWSPETTGKVQSLGKLAFEQLQKGNLIFCKSDLSKYGLDAAEITRYSGVFREEPGLNQDKVYCFIHLTVQEFLAALHVHQTFFSSGENLLSPPHSSVSPEAFYHSAVDQALQSPNGHLDLFLRFLLGLSLPTNQRLLTGLLTETGSDQTNQEMVKYIKEKLNEEGLSAERNLNLLHCLNELNDCGLVEQIQKFMRKGRLSGRDMSPGQWSALSFLLLFSDLEEFDLREFCPSEKGLLGLLPVVKASTKATLSSCGLSQSVCAPLASVLSSSKHLKHLDLSNNDLQDSGVERLCEGLKSVSSHLQTLSLSSCGLSQSVCAPLASVLSSSKHLKHLDLSNNDLQDSGVERLCEGLKSVSSHLQTLSLSSCGLSQSVCAPLASVLSSSKHLKLLDLSNNALRDSGVKLLCEELRGTTCELETLRLSGCLISQEGRDSLAAALSSTLSHVKELDLSYNNIESSTELQSLLDSSCSALQILRLNDAEE